MYCLIGQESVMTSLNWQIGLQTKHCRALCTFGRTSKCRLGFLTYCLWAYTTSKLQIFSQRNGVYFYETKNWHLTNKQPKLLTIFVWESSVGSFRFASGCFMIRSDIRLIIWNCTRINMMRTAKETFRRQMNEVIVKARSAVLSSWV